VGAIMAAITTLAAGPTSSSVWGRGSGGHRIHTGGTIRRRTTTLRRSSCRSLRSTFSSQRRPRRRRKRTGTTARARRRTIRPLQAVPNRGSRCQRGAGSESNAPRVGSHAPAPCPLGHGAASPGCLHVRAGPGDRDPHCRTDRHGSGHLGRRARPPRRCAGSLSSLRPWKRGGRQSLHRVSPRRYWARDGTARWGARRSPRGVSP